MMRPSISNKLDVTFAGYGYKVTRTQYALTSALCRIVYGAQGESFKTVVADLGVPPGQDLHKFWLALYVMITRATSLEGILFIRLPPREALESGPPEEVRVELLQRLRDLHKSTCK